MKIKMYHCNNFKNIYGNIKDKKIPIKIAYKLNKLIQQIEKTSDFFETEFKKIVDEYAEKDESGAPVYIENNTAIKIKDGKTQECDKKIIELNNLEVDIEPIQLTEEEMDLLDKLELTFQDFSILLIFIQVI